MLKSLNHKIVLFITIIIAIFFFINFTAYQNLKHNLDLTHQQKDKLIFAKIKNQSAKLLDEMITDFLITRNDILKQHGAIASKLHGNPDALHDLAALIADLSPRFGKTPDALFVMSRSGKVVAASTDKELIHGKHFFHMDKLQLGPFVSKPIYEPHAEAFYSYANGLVRVGGSEYILQLAYSNGDYKKFLRPIKEYMHANPAILSVQAYIICQNGYTYKLHIDGDGSSHIAKSAKVQKIFEKLQKDPVYIETKKRQKHIFFQEDNTKFDHSISAAYRIVLDQSDAIAQNKRLDYLFIIAALLSVFLIFAAYLFIKNIFLRPILAMQDAITKQLPLADRNALKRRDELGVLARNYNDMYEAIHRQLEKKDDLIKQQDIFVKDSIHEIRTPLSIITLNNELRNKKYGTDKYSKQIAAAVKSLNVAYEDLNFSIEQERDGFVREELDLGIILEERVHYFKAIAEVNKKRLLLTMNHSCIVHMSRKEIARLIDNNLSNAIKYAYPDTTIKIELTKRSGNDCIAISFISHSPKISDTDVIFERYQRENNVKGGHGLGLSIVKKIAEKYDISIDVQSSNEETRFTYVFYCYTL